MNKVNSSNSAKIIIMIILIVLSTLIYLFCSNKIIQIICSFILILFLLSKIYSNILKKNIRIKRTVDSFRINRKDIYEITIEVTNLSRLPIFYCAIHDTPSPLNVFGSGARFCISLKPKRKIYLSYNVSGNIRGEFFIGPLVLETADPLGLFKVEIIEEKKCKALIIPAKRDIQQKLTQGNPQGSIIVNEKKYEDLSLYRSIRDYQPGDEIKRINWKASAKYNKLFTNEYQNSINAPVFIYLEMDLSLYPSQFRYNKLEEAIENTAALLMFAKNLKQKSGFASNGLINIEQNNLLSEIQPFYPARNGQTEMILDFLATIKPVDSTEQKVISMLEKVLWSLSFGSTFYYVGSNNISLEEKRILSMFENKLNIKYLFCSD